MQKCVYPCVFVADDDEDDHLLLHSAFARHGEPCLLVFVQDGLALLDALARCVCVPQLIILDLNMPRLNGFEVLQQLRAYPIYQYTPIIILTTSDSGADRKRAQTLRATAFMTKPTSSTLLDQLVMKLRTDWLNEPCWSKTKVILPRT